MFVVEYCFPPSNKVYAKNHKTFQEQRRHIDNIIRKGGIILREQEFDASRRFVHPDQIILGGRRF